MKSVHTGRKYWGFNDMIDDRPEIKLAVAVEMLSPGDF